MIQLMLGDCLQKLTELPDNSVDSIVTDPPYGLSFMGKAWDYDVPGQNIWTECLRVLKPGGHLLAFFGTRTYHRGVCRIEDAGFEIRDQIMWLYGSGFPKSTNIALRIDKESGAIKTRGGVKMKMGHGDTGITKPSTGSEPFEPYLARSPEATQWEGWGTALKPANEPIVVARKPLEKGLTVAENVLKWGTGALNIDGSRIECESRPLRDATAKVNDSNWGTYQGSKAIGETNLGRWPANVILDEEAAKALDEQSGILKSGARKQASQKEGTFNAVGSKMKYTKACVASEGGASRFFYVAKASKAERNRGLEGLPLVESGIKNDSGRGFSESDPHKKILNQNFHPTVKPIKLMSYLINLVTPPGGTVLDPFMGSGTTGVSAKMLGFAFIGIEREPQYMEIAQKRIESACEVEEKPDDGQLEFPA